MKQSRDDALAQRLIQEAEQTRPAFSESLHERICRDVRRAGISPDVTVFTLRPWWHRPLAAAAVLAVLALGGYRFFQQNPAPEGPSAPIASGPETSQPKTAPDRLAQRENTAPRESEPVSDEELGEEVAVVARSLMDQMPVNLMDVVGDLAETQ